MTRRVFNEQYEYLGVDNITSLVFDEPTDESSVRVVWWTIGKVLKDEAASRVSRVGNVVTQALNPFATSKNLHVATTTGQLVGYLDIQPSMRVSDFVELDTSMRFDHALVKYLSGRQARF